MNEKLTLDEFLTRHHSDHVELIDGVVVPLVPAGARCGALAGRIILHLGGPVIEKNVGAVCSHDTFVLIRKNPPRVRGADLVVWARADLPDGVPQGMPEAPPVFCAEMCSATYPWDAVLEKVADYLSAGARAVFVFDSREPQVAVFRPSGIVETFAATDTLTAPDVLPGFAVPVAAFYGH